MELNEKQIQILEVAEKLFAENGFDGTSVRQISKEADVNVAMISYYFGSKEKMLEALLGYRMADFKIQLKSILSKEISYPEKIDEIVAFVVMRIHKNRRTHKIVNFEYSKDDSQSINFEKYLQQKDENYRVIEAFVKNGQKEGFFSKKVNIPLIVPTIMGTYFHFYYNKRFYTSLHNLTDEISLDEFVHTTLTKHIQQTIKALLTYAD
ncbi:TetR/AcrR family transcriptional regulator [Aequorivita sp. CIP111184]|uniref:TetR/AcrR family transcriptional regulator n=1 Tax=Aequorivita sp. CIP111184 TaxID=2211356 RepID=UPI000DBC1385|nr:TetR/AcrR family transcriptional regulator [Aequorivita sp. CIP111184]SRX55743.1 putative HTH-type transcriptional regulator YttP [Aequorivita sp. CIP111184]